MVAPTGLEQPPDGRKAIMLVSAGPRGQRLFGRDGRTRVEPLAVAGSKRRLGLGAGEIRAGLGMLTLLGAVFVGALHAGTGIVNSSDLTGQQLAFAAWGQGQFVAAGLAAPPVSFEFHADTTGCGLRQGRYFPTSHVVQICAFSPETLLHELAHAWAERYLTDEAKKAFMRYRGVEVWNDHSVPWEERGMEHAASVIAWGVEERNVATRSESIDAHALPLPFLPNSDPGELAAAYVVLTGMPVSPSP